MQTSPESVRSRVGVVVAARDADRWLDTTLDSLLAQTHRDWVCVVADDGSRDRTRAVAEAYTRDPRVRVTSTAGVGPAGARNAATALLPADVDLLHFLDADDVLLPDALAVLLAALRTRPDAVAVYGYADYVDEAGTPFDPGLHPSRQADRRRVRGVRLRPVPESADSTFDDLVNGNPVWPAAVGLHRRRVVDALGGMAEELRQLEDWDLYLRMSRSGPLVPVPRVVAQYRRHDRNLTGDTLVNLSHRELVLRRAWVCPDTTGRQRRDVAVASWWRRANDARAAAGLVGSCVREGRFGPAARAAAGLVWTAAVLLGPPSGRGGNRRVRWARGLTATARSSL